MPYVCGRRGKGEQRGGGCMRSPPRLLGFVKVWRAGARNERRKHRPAEPPHLISNSPKEKLPSNSLVNLSRGNPTVHTRLRTPLGHPHFCSGNRVTLAQQCTVYSLAES